MKILAIDAARTTGWCFGNGSEVPDSGSIRLAGGDGEIEDLPASMAGFLLRKIRQYKPELIALEQYLNPAVQMGQAPVVTSLLLHGSVCAMAGLYRIPFVTCTPPQWRKSFVGRSTARPRSDGRRTPKQKAEDRAATKAMVLDRAKLLCWLPQD